MNPLISVIIPTYKNKGGLQESIESVLNQTYKNLEIIVVDDNNSDDNYRKSTELLMSNYNGHSNVIYLKHIINSNGAVARNTGIKASNGEYIAFLDDDDLFKEDKLEKQLNYLMSNKFDCVYCKRMSHNVLSEVPINKEGDLTEDLLLLNSQLQTSLLLFKKNVLLDLNGFDENFLRHQDYEIMLRFFEKGYKIGYIPNTYTIIGHQGQNRIFGKKMYEIKQQFLNQFDHIIEVVNKKKPGFKEELYLKHYTSLFIALLKGKEFGLASELFFKHLIKSPLKFITYLIRYTKSFISIKLK